MLESERNGLPPKQSFYIFPTMSDSNRDLPNPLWDCRNIISIDFIYEKFCCHQRRPAHSRKKMNQVPMWVLGTG